MEAASAQAQCATALGDRCALDPAAPQAAQGHPRKEAWINKCGRESPLQVRQVTKSSGHKVLGNRCTHAGRQKKEVHLLLMLVVVQLRASNTCMQGPPLPASPHAAWTPRRLLRGGYWPRWQLAAAGMSMPGSLRSIRGHPSPLVPGHPWKYPSLERSPFPRPRKKSNECYFGSTPTWANMIVFIGSLQDDLIRTPKACQAQCMNSTTPRLQLHYTNYSCTNYITLHPAVVGEVTDQGTTATIATAPKKHNSNHLSVHQWIRSAICDSQQPTSPIVSYFWNFRHRLERYHWYHT